MLLTNSILVALAAAFAVLLFSRLEVSKGTTARRYLQIHAPKLISEMVSCDFCLCFWMSVLLTVIIMFPLTRVDALFIPFLATPVARFLVG